MTYSNIVSTIFGSGITILIFLINEFFYRKRSKLEHKRNLDILIRNQQFELSKNFVNTLNLELIKIHYHLSFLESNISLTSSVIVSSSKIDNINFDKNHKLELEHIYILKSSIYTHFPQCNNLIEKIDSLFNKYWGNQRMLNEINSHKEFESYKSMLEPIITICNDTSVSINELRIKLVALKPQTSF